ncbi:hypothetical protein RhiirC2_100246 [Rhizophagus irregularis]|uniref:Uncharacterized protein n=1 Tax=Rhizophagus irregularis TaxID=588596 RepID=A0A2N1MSA8_9GLOM|nr:hypothetical protein RhiirC2_100246 [Rhizophagus irregularis]
MREEMRILVLTWAVAMVVMENALFGKMYAPLRGLANSSGENALFGKMDVSLWGLANSAVIVFYFGIDRLLGRFFSLV